MWLLWRPSHMICCLQAGEPRQWCHLVPDQSPENPGSQWYKSEPKGWRTVGRADGVSLGPSLKAQEPECPCLGAGENGCPSSNKLQILPFSAILFYLVSQQFGWCPLAFLKVISFAEPTHLNANLLQKHPQRNTQKQCFTSCLGIPLAQSSWNITLTFMEPNSRSFIIRQWFLHLKKKVHDKL